MSQRPGATPGAPQTAEFGYVTPGGPAHSYPPVGGMSVTKFSVGPFDNNVYILRCDETGQSIVIDGATDAERIITELGDSTCIGVLQTHNHPDHVQALPELISRLKVPVYANPGDSAKMGVPTKRLVDGQSMRVGTVEVNVLYTPGHTPGGLSFLANGHLFSGDTLFPAGPGNTFGNREAFTTIMKSLDRLFTLPDDTTVSPGHGLDTTIGRERPHVETWRARGW